MKSLNACFRCNSLLVGIVITRRYVSISAPESILIREVEV
jgi:hypothetical protein